MKKKILYASLAVVGFVLVVLGNPYPITSLLLQGTANGGGNNFTNLGTVNAAVLLVNGVPVATTAGGGNSNYFATTNLSGVSIATTSGGTGNTNTFAADSTVARTNQWQNTNMLKNSAWTTGDSQSGAPLWLVVGNDGTNHATDTLSNSATIQGTLTAGATTVDGNATVYGVFSGVGGLNDAVTNPGSLTTSSIKFATGMNQATLKVTNAIVTLNSNSPVTLNTNLTVNNSSASAILEAVDINSGTNTVGTIDITATDSSGQDSRGVGKQYQAHLLADGTFFSKTIRYHWPVAYTNYTFGAYCDHIVAVPTNGSMNVILPCTTNTGKFGFASRGWHGGNLIFSDDSVEYKIYNAGTNTCVCFTTNHNAFNDTAVTNFTVYPGSYAWMVCPDGTNIFAWSSSGSAAGLILTNGIGAPLTLESGALGFEILNVQSNGVEFAGINQFGHFKSDPGTANRVAFGQQGNGTNGLFFGSSNSVNIANNGSNVFAASNGVTYANGGGVTNVQATNVAGLTSITNTELYGATLLDNLAVKTNLTVYGKTTNYGQVDFTSNPFVVNTLWTNSPTWYPAIGGRRASGSVTFYITPSVTVQADVAVIVTLGNGSVYAITNSYNAVTAITTPFFASVPIPMLDSNSIINVTNVSSAGPTISVSSSVLTFQ